MSTVDKQLVAIEEIETFKKAPQPVEIIKLFVRLSGEGARLPAIHPGAGYRDLAALHQQDNTVVSA